MVVKLSPSLFADVEKQTREEVLLIAYWEIIDQGKEFEESEQYKASLYLWKHGDRSDPHIYNHYYYDVAKAEGFMRAARDIAEILGIPENKMPRPR